jgi:uncharacterized protein (DUF1330 family)
MSVYILAITKITDAEKYNSEFMPAIKKAHKAHDVKVVAMSNAPQMLMGEPRGNHVVLLQVQDEAHARAFSGTAQRQKPPWPLLHTVCPRAASESSLVQRSWWQRLKANSLLRKLLNSYIPTDRGGRWLSRLVATAQKNRLSFRHSVRDVFAVASNCRAIAIL